MAELANGTYGGMSLEERNMFGVFYYDHFYTVERDESRSNRRCLVFLTSHFYGTVIDSITRTPDLKDICDYAPDLFT